MLDALVESVARVAEPWRDLYATSTAVSTGVLFAHIAALVVGGGLALAADRGTLRAARAAGGAAFAARARQLDDLAAAHRTVAGSLAVLAASGALLFLADVEEFVHAPVFWLKMGLVAALLVNGWAMTRAERALAREPEGAPAREPWGRLRAHAAASAALWLATLLAGTLLSSV